MYLVFIYNSFIFKLFLSFLLLLTFSCVVLEFKLVLGHLCWRIEELYMSGLTSLHWQAEEPKLAKQFGEFLLVTYCKYMLFFRFDASPKKLFVSYDYVLFFIWLPWHLRYHRVSNKLGGGGLNNGMRSKFLIYLIIRGGLINGGMENRTTMYL